jgi:integrase/recombinase XerC
MSKSVLDSAGLEAARLPLERMGIKPSDLLEGGPARPAAPTFAEYVPIVRASISAGTLRCYGTYFDRVVARWGSRGIDQVNASDVRSFVADIKADALQRRNSRVGAVPRRTRFRRCGACIGGRRRTGI